MTLAQPGTTTPESQRSQTVLRIAALEAALAEMEAKISNLKPGISIRESLHITNQNE